MIDAEVFQREMRRSMTADTDRGAMGLHVSAWMLEDNGQIKDDIGRQLFGLVWKMLRDEADMVAFVNYLLDENAAGRVHYFPKLSEMKTYLRGYLASAGRPEAKQKISRAYEAQPPPNPEIRARMEEAAHWWVTMRADIREESRKEIITELATSGNMFMAEYLENRTEEQWMNPLEWPLIMVEIEAFYKARKECPA